MKDSIARRFALGSLAVLALTGIVTKTVQTAAQPVTEIVVVGTVHAATASYTAQDLIRIFERVRPDVILNELPADMMTPSFEFKPTVKVGLEREAIVEYVRRTGTKMRPYDIDGRNVFYERTNYFARQRQCNQELSAQIDTNELGGEAQKIMGELMAANASRDALGESAPRVINSFQSDTAISEKQWLMHQGIPEIVRLTKTSKECEAYWNLVRAYWTRRNNEMVHNIRRLATEFAGKRLVVLCGFEHRYYLRRGLHVLDDQPGYVVKEYWEY